jgi:hypothetical protein
LKINVDGSGAEARWNGKLLTKGDATDVENIYEKVTRG